MKALSTLPALQRNAQGQNCVFVFGLKWHGAATGRMGCIGSWGISGKLSFSWLAKENGGGPSG